jgi:hypothetical protein
MTISVEHIHNAIPETNSSGNDVSGVTVSTGEVLIMVVTMYDTSSADGVIYRAQWDFGGTDEDFTKAIEYYDSLCDGHVSIWYLMNPTPGTGTVRALTVGTVTDAMLSAIVLSTTLDAFELDGTPVSNTGTTGDVDTGTMAYVAGSIQFACMLDDQTSAANVSVRSIE